MDSTVFSGDFSTGKTAWIAWPIRLSALASWAHRHFFNARPLKASVAANAGGTKDT
jgi:hypothetical protein